MTTCGFKFAVAAARFCITSARRSGDSTSTMPTRWRYAATTAAACEVSIGEPSIVWCGRHDVAAPARRSRSTSPEISSSRRLGRLVGRLPAIEHAADDRAPQVVLASGRRFVVPDPAAPSAKSIWSIPMAAMPASAQTFAGPPRRRSVTGSSASSASSASTVATGTVPERQPHDVAVVQPGGGLGDRAVGLRGRDGRRPGACPA